MDYKSLFIHYKKYIITGVAILIIITVGIVAVLKSKGSSERSKPSSSSSYDSSNSDRSNLPDGGEYDYTEAPNHIGENATIKGTVLRVFTSKSGVTFLDFCKNSQTCPFSAVIFAGDLESFKDIQSYQREVKIKGLIKSYQGRTEIILNGPEQIE